MKSITLIALALLAAATSVQSQEPVDAEALEAARQDVMAARQELERATQALSELVDEPMHERHEFRTVIRTGQDSRPIIGIVMGRPDSSGEGVRINAVTPGGPAAEAGVSSGDVLVAINGTAVHGRHAADQARELFDGMSEGDTYILTLRSPGEDGTHDLTVEAAEQAAPTVFEYATGMTEPMIVNLNELPGQMVEVFGEDGERLTVDVKGLTEQIENITKGMHIEMPELAGSGAQVNVWRWGFGWSGLELARLNDGLGRYFGVEEGALVLDTEGMEETALLPGDVIISVSGRPVMNPNEVMRELRRYDSGEQVTVEVVRDGRPIEIDVAVPGGPQNDFSFGYDFRERGQN